jgi:ADP-ribose pyrophosphatase YjhB (NUDIX family)
VTKNSHCSYCGARFTDGPFPRTCAACGQTTWLNPLPVTVLLCPVDDGLLLIRRAIPPVGKLALPGGYIDAGESWQEAGARELREEAGIEISPSEISDFWVRSSPAPDRLVIIFGQARPRRSEELAPFAVNSEVSERLIARTPMELAFSLHTDAMAAWFQRRG